MLLEHFQGYEFPSWVAWTYDDIQSGHINEQRKPYHPGTSKLVPDNHMHGWQGPVSITNGHLLICDWCFRILKGSKMQSLDSDKRCY